MRYTKISMTDVIIAGAGAAGLMTANYGGTARTFGNGPRAERKNGEEAPHHRKGPVQVTNDSAPQEFLQKVCTNGALPQKLAVRLSAETVKDFFEEAGVRSKPSAASACFPFPITPTTLPIRWSAWQKAPAFALSGNVLLTSGQRADTFPQR